MKHIFLLLMAGIALPSIAQKIQNHYIVREEAEATIHHTMPATLFENTQMGELTYDITWCDQVGDKDPEATLNFTYFSEEPMPVDSLTISGERLLVCRPCSKLYIEPEKRGWRHRYTLSLPIEELFELYTEQAPRILLHCSQDEMEYTPKPKAWEHYAPIGQRIMQTIALNRR